MKTTLKLAILGNGTLAKATSECCAQHHEIVTCAFDQPEVVWICHDTPLLPTGEPDSEWVLAMIRRHVADFDNRPLFLVSSQMPVGTTAKLEEEFPSESFAHSPENIRVATAVADFNQQARIVVGRRASVWDEILKTLFAPFTEHLILTDPETAEMVKHALNCWLGMNIAFINEVARICSAVDADASKVALALQLDRRVGTNAPLKPGRPFGGGHLERDIHNVVGVAHRYGISVPIIAHILESNRQ